MGSGIRRLTVPAENLDIDVTLRGAGPLVVLLPGATGMPFGYAPLIRLLSGRNTVATYDRRGHGRSAGGVGPLEISRHARDLAAVVDAIGEGAAHVVGSSAGATIGLELLARFPDRVRILLAHEPPLVTLVDDAARWRAWYEDLVEINERVGTRTSFDYFFAHLVSDGAGEQPQVSVPDSHLPEWDVYFRRELRRIVAYEPDAVALKNVRDALVPVIGADSRAYWHGRAVLALGEQVGAETAEVPGGHLAPIYQPVPFHEAIRDRLSG